MQSPLSLTNKQPLATSGVPSYSMVGDAGLQREPATLPMWPVRAINQVLAQNVSKQSYLSLRFIGLA